MLTIDVTQYATHLNVIAEQRAFDNRRRHAKNIQDDFDFAHEMINALRDK